MFPDVSTETSDVSSKKNRKEVHIFMESQYIYKIIKEFQKKYGKKYRIEYEQFAIILARSLNFWLTKTYYYTAPPHQSARSTENERERKRNYDKVMNYYRKKKNFEIREGRCQKIKDKYHEKGVDTLLIMDLMETAHKNKVKNVILVTSDTDYVPVIEEIREKHGFNVYLFHYTDKIRGSKFSLSNHLESSCTESVPLTKEHFEKSQLKG